MAILGSSSGFMSRQDGLVKPWTRTTAESRRLCKNCVCNKCCLRGAVLQENHTELGQVTHTWDSGIVALCWIPGFNSRIHEMQQNKQLLGLISKLISVFCWQSLGASWWRTGKGARNQDATKEFSVTCMCQKEKQLGSAQSNGLKS